MCKQNDKTKSVPGNFNLTLKLHKHTDTLYTSPVRMTILFSVGGGRKGKVTVQSKDVGSRILYTRHYKSCGRESFN